MATSKPAATISYNTLDFLKPKLDYLVTNHTLQSYQFIFHKGEDGDSDHVHLRIEPNKRLDLMDISDYLEEYCLGEDKPRRVRPWRPSVESDWFLYAVHWKPYLDLKYHDSPEIEHEKIPYDFKDIVVSDGYDLDVAWIRALQSFKHSPQLVFKDLTHGHKSGIDLFLQGESIYTISAIQRLMRDDKYSARLAAEKEEIEGQLNLVLFALRKIGYSLQYDENGKPFLFKKVDNETIYLYDKEEVK